MSSGSGKKGSCSSSIPPKMRETVQNLKEIVNCPEQEIYAMLRECNMDPNETVHRLLTQDTFHEVKSKREKKKEIKGTGESRSQKVSSSSSGQGIRGGVDHAGRSAAQINSDDCEVARGKPAQMKSNVARNDNISSVLGSKQTTINSLAWSVAPSSYNDAIGSTIHYPGLSDSISLHSPPSSSQYNWGRGQLSMADIVKMGRHPRKPPSSTLEATEVCNSLSHKTVVPNTSQGRAICITTTDIPSEANQEVFSKQDNAFRDAKASDDLSIVISQHEPLEEWTLVYHSVEETSPVLIGGSCASVHHEPSASSSLHIDEIDSHLSSHVDDVQKLEHVSGKDLPTESTISDGQVRADDSHGSSCLDDGSFRNSSSYQQHESEDFREELSSATANLQHVSLHIEEQSATLTEENHAVIIPGHLQVTNADFSHLSFGSFGSGVGTPLNGALLPKPAKGNLEVTVTENAPTVDSATRNPEYYNNEQLRTTSDDSVSSITSTSSRNYDVTSTSQPERSRDDTFISEQHNIPSVPSFGFAGTMQPDDAAYIHAEANCQMQNLAPLTSLTQPLSDSAPSNILAGDAQPLREPDLSFPRLLANQSMPTKYSPPMASFGGPTISMPEVLKSGLLSTFQSIPQTTSSTTISSGPTLPPYRPFPTYSQPTLPLGPLTNMFSYPVLPQSIPYMPFSGNSTMHQSPASLQSAGMRYTSPQFKSSMPLNGLSQTLPFGSGYGGFGGSTSIPGAFLQNPSNASAGTSIGYEEALRSQYKESGPLHQGECSWLSRTLPAVPASNFYGMQGPSQQGSSFLRQGQQPTHMGILGYQNLYHTQVGGISREHQHLPSQGNLNGSQGQSSQQVHQLWQHSY